MSIKLIDAKSFMYTGKYKYLVTYDYDAGRMHRYTVLILNVDDPVTIGRELDLKSVRMLIQKYEKHAPDVWYGDRESVLDTLTKITK